MPNTEFKFDSHLNGFELQSNKIGSLNISIVEFNQKPLGDSASNLISNSKYLPDFKLIDKFDFQLQKGFNKLDLGYSIKIPKGSLILIETFEENLLTIDTSNNFLYSDYFVNQSELIRLDVKQNWRFYFSCVIDEQFYLNYFDFSQIYSMNASLNFKQFSLIVKLNENDLTLERKFFISNSKIL